MKIEHKDYDIRITLSRRNLRALIAKLDGHPKPSACEIMKGDDEGYLVRVRAEEDAEHYTKMQPGPMHPETEAEIKEQQS